MTTVSDPPAILAELRPSPGRRIFGAASLGVLGFLLVYLAAAAMTPLGGLGYRLALLIAGVAGLWLAWRLWQATGDRILLTEEAVQLGSGRVLARLDEIARVDRGMFVFKPSGGFLILRKTKGPGGWAPGLWWASGKRIGVGGTTRAAEARYMAEVIVAALAKRDQSPG